LLWHCFPETCLLRQRVFDPWRGSIE